MAGNEKGRLKNMTGKTPKTTSRVGRGPRINLKRAVLLPTASVMALGASTFGFVLSAPTGASPEPVAPVIAAQVDAATVVADDSIAAGVPVNGPASISRPLKVGAQTGGLVRAAAAGPASEIPSAALSAYQRAESIILAADKSCGIRWQLIAAIGEVESNHGRFGGSALDNNGVASPAIIGLPLNGKSGTRRITDTDAGQYDGDQKLDRAVGPMQFIPSTWSVVGVDADGDGVRNPQDIDDAALGTAVYLCSGDEDLSTTDGAAKAVFRYNRSDEYVDLVLSLMRQYEQNSVAALPDTQVAAGYAIPAPGADSPANAIAARPSAQKPGKAGKGKTAKTGKAGKSKGPKKGQSSATASASAKPSKGITLKPSGGLSSPGTTLAGTPSTPGATPTPAETTPPPATPPATETTPPPATETTPPPATPTTEPPPAPIEPAPTEDTTDPALYAMCESADLVEVPDADYDVIAHCAADPGLYGIDPTDFGLEFPETATTTTVED